MKPTQKKQRVGADERREQILAAALTEFSQKGLHGGSTVNIAQAVGISHPNVFRLYPTKIDLFTAVLEQAFATVARTMLKTGETTKDEPLQAMANAWGVLMDDRELMLILLQGYAASADTKVRELMQGWTRDVFERMEALPSVGTDLAHDFFAAGMLYMIAASMDLPAQTNKVDWIKRFLESGR
ncbi:TetR/AcrR family transcriptional regulator [Mesorhizobium sp. SB112]|uniref:TetR/AcrR family transcriptional regulator n=1 Tax=Mesorhizobium sp. SB112 TaxID=3151853 RepID=UPI003266FA51